MFLQVAGRGGEMGDVPEGEYLLPLGKAEIKQPGDDVTLVAIGSMVRPALRVASELREEGISVEVIDPRTLVPLDEEAIVASVRKTGRLVVVDEARQRCSAGSEIVALAMERCFDALRAPALRINVANVAIPYSPPLEKAVIPDEARIAAAVRKVLGVSTRS
jgi:pyruvate dehydrogenase E1 component beta subunit